MFLIAPPKVDGDHVARQFASATESITRIVIASLRRAGRPVITREPRVIVCVVASQYETRLANKLSSSAKVKLRCTIRKRAGNIVPFRLALKSK